MGKHAQPQQPEENGTSQYPASGEEGGVGKQGMGRGKLIAIIAAIVVVALVLLQVVPVSYTHLTLPTICSV